jgi:hypothetical protein
MLDSVLTLEWVIMSHDVLIRHAIEDKITTDVVIDCPAWVGVNDSVRDFLGAVGGGLA